MIVSLDAGPFQHASSPLEFRAISGGLSIVEGYLEASEACLIHADMQSYLVDSSQRTNPTNGVFVNTLVRVYYNTSAKRLHNSIQQLFMERIYSHFVAWAYDIRNWCIQGRLARDINQRMEKVRVWEQQTGKKEVGAFCLTDQLQILRPDGWAHI
jgi:hypothetical protein